MSHKIKLMQPSDAEALEVLEKACFLTPWTAEMLREELSENDCFFYGLYNDKAVLCGYAGMRSIAGEGHIMNLCVLPDYRHSGFGDALLTALIEKAKEENLSFLTLEVRISNDAAISLYKKHRFIEMGIRPGYYFDTGEDALIMTMYPNETMHLFRFGEEE